MKRQDARTPGRWLTKPEEPSEEIDQLVSELLAAAIEVHRVLGPGFLEGVYEAALCVELGLRNLPYRRQVPVDVEYKGHRVGQGCLDLLISGSIVVELKAIEVLPGTDSLGPGAFLSQGDRLSRRCAHQLQRPCTAPRSAPNHSQYLNAKME